jgi:hypothetical protein
LSDLLKLRSSQDR